MYMRTTFLAFQVVGLLESKTSSRLHWLSDCREKLSRCPIRPHTPFLSDLFPMRILMRVTGKIRARTAGKRRRTNWHFCSRCQQGFSPTEQEQSDGGPRLRETWVP